MKPRPPTKQTYVQPKLSPRVSDEFLVEHFSNMNLRRRAAVHAETVDKEYSASQAFWADVIKGDLNALRWVRLVNFQISSWYPRSPGLYHTESAAFNRKEAETSITERDGVHFYDPFGKGNMIQGGLGSVRFQDTKIDGDECWLGTAVDDGYCHSGIPLVIPDKLARQVRTDTGDRFSITGKLHFLPPFLSKRFGHLTSIPQLYLRVDKLERTQTTIANLLITPMVFFVTSSVEDGRSPASVTYVTCPAGDSREMQKAVDWLKWYADMYRGEIVTDFDEQRPMFENVPFSLQNVMKGRVELTRLRSLISDAEVDEALTEATQVTINVIEGDLVKGDKVERDKYEVHQVTGGGHVGPSKNGSGGDPIWKKALEVLSKPVPLLIINVIAALLFFPFQLSTSVPGVTAILGSLGLGWVAWRQRKAFLLIVAFLAGLSGVGWAAIGPFVLSNGPFYCYVADGVKNPLGGKIVAIGKGAVAHLFYITDPVRSSELFKRLIQRVHKDVIFLDFQSDGEQRSMLIPLRTAIRHSVAGTSDVNSAEQLLLSYYGPAVTVESDGRSFTVAVSEVYYPIVAHTNRGMSSGGARWESVAFAPQAAMKAATYVVYTDVGLIAAARGDFETAIEDLETALQFAPSNLEKARNRALLGIVSWGILHGNIGETQALSYFSEAIQQWPLAQLGRRLNDSDIKAPLDRNLYYVFRSTFFPRQKEFRHWAEILGLNALPRPFTTRTPIKGGERFLTYNAIVDPLEETLVTAEKNRLVSLIGPDGNTDALERDLRERHNSSEGARLWIAEQLIYESVEAFGNALLFPNKPENNLQLNRIQTASEWAIKQLPEPRRSQYLKCFSWSKILGAANLKQLTQGPNDYMKALSSFAKESNFPSLADTMDQVLQQKDDYEFNKPSRASTEAWWERSFLDWFGASLFPLAKDIDRNCRHPSQNCRMVLNSIGHQFERDRSGRGRLFAPAIALILTIAQAWNQQIDSDWKVLYKEAVGADWPDAPAPHVVRTRKPS